MTLPNVFLAGHPDIQSIARRSQLGIAFPKFKNERYDVAAQMARKADFHREEQIGRALFHFAFFLLEATAGAELALALTQLLAGVRGKQFTARGRLLTTAHEVTSVLGCYLNAKAAIDWRAHCLLVVTAPELGKFESSKRYVMPCSYLHSRGRRVRLDHPSTVVHQLDALAVDGGCDWCPNFHPEEYRPL